MKKTLLFLAFFCFTASAQTPYRAVLYDGTTAPPWVKLMALTLAGIVNRDSARLYLQNVYETWSYSQTDERWADLYRTRGNVQFDVVTSDTALVRRFRPFIKGGIRYDYLRTFGNFPGQSFMWQGEYAALIGGLTDRLPLTFGMWNRYNLPVEDSVLVDDAFDGDLSVWVPGKLDTLTLPWNHPALPTESDRYLTMLDWGVRVLLPRCNPERFYIREITDFAVQRKMFQVNLAGTDALKIDSIPPARFDIIERVVTYLQGKDPGRIFHIYGWIQPESLTQWLAYFGSSFHETLLANLSWHSAFPVPVRTYQRASIVREDTTVLRGKYHLLFQSSEGDASNWVLSFQSGAWFSPKRGIVPVGWGWNLHLLDMMPFVAGYYCDTATPGDGFTSVLTPLGFSYPDYWPDGALRRAIDSSRALMAKFRVNDIYGYKHYEGSGAKYYRGKLITDDYLLDRYAQFQLDIGATSTVFFNSTPAAQRPTVYRNVLFLNHKGDGSFYGDVSNLADAASRIVGSIKALPKPGFLLAGYQRFRNDEIPAGSRGSEDLTIARLDSLVRLIKADPVVGADVEVVTPELFSVLMRRHTGMLAVGSAPPLPGRFALRQNYPNPFNPATVITYALPVAGTVRIAVYDLLGREVALLVDERKEAGEHSVQLNGGGLGTGVYFCRMEARDYSATVKMLLVK